MLWDDNYLYIGAVLEEPNVWADITKHDAIVYNNPDFEVFIDPDGDGQNYFEIEANAIGVNFRFIPTETLQSIQSRFRYLLLGLPRNETCHTR